MKRQLSDAIVRFRTAVCLDDRPWRIALALAVGVFISCTPFYGLQTILSILVATILRLNRAVTVAGAWLNLPWFAPFVYAGALKLGGVLFPDRQGLQGVSVALLIGTTIVGAVAGVVTYLIALALMAWRRGRGAGAGSTGRVSLESPSGGTTAGPIVPRGRRPPRTPPADTPDR